MSLPDPRQLLSTFLHSLSTLPASSDPTELPTPARTLLLTLHCILPSTLLPALDLLDRGQVGCYTGPEYSVYYVQSTARYEVRIDAWNCSCASFAFAAACAEPGPDGEVAEGEMEWEGKGGKEEWVWGGMMRGREAPPVCKHLVACVLAEKCGGLFGGLVKREVVSRGVLAEMAVVWD